MSDESKNYTLVQGARDSTVSLTYHAENITIVQLLYQLDEAKKNKDSDAFEELVNISEAVFRQDKFNQLPLEDRIRIGEFMEEHDDLKKRFYEFENEVMYEHFPGIESEIEAYRGLFENARNEIYESRQVAENNELEIEKFKAKEEYKLMKAQAKEEKRIRKVEAREARKTKRLEARILKKNEREYNRQFSKNNNIQSDFGKRMLSGIESLFKTDLERFPESLKFVGRFVVPGSLTYLSLLAINHNFDWLMSDYNELIAGSLVGLVGGATWNVLYYNNS